MAYIFQGSEETRKLIENMLDLMDDGYILDATLVPTSEYGSEGMMPIDGACPQYTGNEISCVSGSGGSLCGCFMGCEGTVVICGYTKKEEQNED